MSMTKTPKTTLLKITRDNPHGWVLDAVYECDEPIWEEVARVSERFHGTAHRIAGRISAAKFEEHLTKDFRERSAPPAAPKPLPVDDVCKKFGWTLDMLERAQAKYGFPRSKARIALSWRANVPAFAHRDVERWTEEFREFVAHTRLDGYGK